MKLNASRIAQLFTVVPWAVCQKQLLLLFLKCEAVQLVISLGKFLQSRMWAEGFWALCSHLVEEIRLTHVEIQIVACVCGTRDIVSCQLLYTVVVPVRLIRQHGNFNAHRSPVLVQFEVQVQLIDLRCPEVYRGIWYVVELVGTISWPGRGTKTVVHSRRVSAQTDNGLNCNQLVFDLRRCYQSKLASKTLNLMFNFFHRIVILGFVLPI